MGEKNLDYKKEFKDLYLPPAKPVLVTVPAMQFIMVDGTGDPNGNQGFQQAVELLYGLSFTIKMSKMKNQQPEGYFDYVVPPLEGLWWIDGGEFSFEKRDNWRWTLMIRQPEFVTPKVFAWAGQGLAAKKPGLPLDKARFEGFEEGLCVQAMHLGPYATEPETMAKIEDFIRSHGLKDRLGRGGKHHEIYLSDPMKAKPEKMKTVLRHPVEKA
ncbi:MAG: GyrI-like domain-containing protein [Firmicutes bacterium]|nr:GyrI-like domain-containing protein [Bacillota bacterium]